MSQKKILSAFENRVRVRVCGILKREGKILLLKHNKIGSQGHLWSPPGGGVEFSEDMRDALKREFKEETNLIVSVNRYLFVNEYIQGKLHAIEHFFLVEEIGGELQLGRDPEMDSNRQIIVDAHFFSEAELKALEPETIHNAFRTVDAMGEIDKIRGLITFKD